MSIGRNSIRSKASPRWKRNGLRLGASIACLALAAGALNIALASPGAPDLDASAAELESQAASQPVSAASGADAPPTGQVVVFEHEQTEVTKFDDPEACNNAPQLAHTIVNLTDQDIILYADHRCGTPLIEVKAGFGSHVAPGQSFSSS